VQHRGLLSQGHIKTEIADDLHIIFFVISCFDIM
jgi:hypothetical protein